MVLILALSSNGRIASLIAERDTLQRKLDDVSKEYAAFRAIIARSNSAPAANPGSAKIIGLCNCLLAGHLDHDFQNQSVSGGVT